MKDRGTETDFPNQNEGQTSGDTGRGKNASRGGEEPTSQQDSGRQDDRSSRGDESGERGRSQHLTESESRSNFPTEEDMPVSRR
jgi:hypothetical protein